MSTEWLPAVMVILGTLVVLLVGYLIADHLDKGGK